MKYVMIDPLDGGRFELFCMAGDDCVFTYVYETKELAQKIGERWLDGEKVVGVPLEQHPIGAYA